MVFRAEDKRQQAGRTVEVEGVLDAAAVEQLQAQLHLGSCDCLLLLPGTEVTADGIERLRRLPSRVISSSPYLERWLAERGPRVDPPEGDREALLVQGAEGSAPPAKPGKL